MKQYTVAQAFSRFLTLKEKHMKKAKWNKEAVSYEINMDRIAQASAMKLATSKDLTEAEISMLTTMAGVYPAAQTMGA